jgi:hypothetical protein
MLCSSLQILQPGFSPMTAATSSVTNHATSSRHQQQQVYGQLMTSSSQS